MKKWSKLICVVLLLIAAVSMFMPIATFEDNSAGAMQEEIDKHTGRLESEQAKLQRYIDGNKSEKDIAKQQEKVAKQQAKVDELVAEMEALKNSASASGLKYALMDAALPEEINVDMQIVLFEHLRFLREE